MNRFARAYSGAELFPPAVRKQQLKWVAGESDPPGPGTNSAGLSVFRYRSECGTVYGQTGNLPGYTGSGREAGGSAPCPPRLGAAARQRRHCLPRSSDLNDKTRHFPRLGHLR